MPHTDAIPASASIASTGKGIRYIGNWAYAYSGLIGVVTSTSPLTALEFNTASNMIDAKFLWSYDPPAINTNQSLTFEILMNDEIIHRFVEYINATYGPTIDFPLVIPIIIPPETSVLCRVGNTGTNQLDTYLTMHGKVF